MYLLGPSSGTAERAASDSTGRLEHVSVLATYYINEKTYNNRPRHGYATLKLPRISND